MAKRKFLTPAERIARAKAEEEKIIKSETGKSYDLTVKSVGWATRSVELGNKSDGARAQAVSKLVSLGQTEDEAEAQVSAWEIEIAMAQKDEESA